MTALRFLRGSVTHIRAALAETPWQTSAFFACVMALISVYNLLVYPNVYTLSKSYTWLATNNVSPHWLGAFGLCSALWTLLTLRYQASIVGLFLVFVYLMVMLGSSLASVGLSAGSGYPLFGALWALRAYWRSGGLIGRD